jgi:serine/threonine-protein kinase RsbW
MYGETAAMSEPRLTLKSQLPDLALIWPWLESLSVEHSIPADTQFAIDLCLEEALSNIIRHGYGSRPDQSPAQSNTQPITIEFSSGEDGLAFTVEDHAPPFNPLHAPEDESPAPKTIDEIPLGGRGIRLMRKFAGGLDYQRLPDGNRLTIRFAHPR